MVKVSNDVLVLYSKANTRVKVDFTEEGKVFPYPNNHHADKDNRRVRFLLKDYFFSGIMFRGLSELVKLEVIDWDYNVLGHIIYKDYLYIEPSQAEFYEVLFKFKNGLETLELKPKFIEQELEVSECESFEIKRKL